MMKQKLRVLIKQIAIILVLVFVLVIKITMIDTLKIYRRGQSICVCVNEY